jgi:hypothetical protein
VRFIPAISANESKLKGQTCCDEKLLALTFTSDVHAKGRCEAMCSIEEQEERQKQHDISQFEATDATRTLRRHLRKMDPEVY